MISSFFHPSSLLAKIETGLEVFSTSYGLGQAVNTLIETRFPNFEEMTKEQASFTAAYTISYLSKDLFDNFQGIKNLGTYFLVGQAGAAIDYGAFRGIAATRNSNILSNSEKGKIRILSNAAGICSGAIQLAFFASAPVWLTTAATIGSGMAVAYGTAQILTQKKVAQIAPAVTQ